MSVRWGSERSSLLPGPIEEGKREREEKVAAAKSESVSESDIICQIEKNKHVLGTICQICTVRQAKMRVATLLLLLWAVAASAMSAVDLCSQSFCACPDAGKRVVCECDGVKVSVRLVLHTFTDVN